MPRKKVSARKTKAHGARPTVAPLYSILIVVHNQPKHVRACLNSVIANSPAALTEILVWDNASAAPTHKVIASLIAKANKAGFWAAAHPGKTNSGFGPPSNELAARATGTYLIFLNSDTVVPPKWLERLTRPFANTIGVKRPVGATAPRYGGACRTIVNDEHGIRGAPSVDDEPEYLEGTCLCIRRDLFLKMGGFDTKRYPFAYCEDADLSLRLRQAGYVLREADMTDFVHDRKVTASEVNKTVDLEGIRTSNRITFGQRWGEYLKTRTFERHITLHRSAARGDCLWLTALAEKLREVRPLWNVAAQTPFPELFYNHPWLYHRKRPLPNNLEDVINLDGAYENQPSMHLLLAYFREVLGSSLEWDGACTPSLHLTDDEMAYGRRIRFGGGPERDAPFAIFHGERTSWPGRNASFGIMQAMADHLLKKGWDVGFIGNSHADPVPFCKDFRGLPVRVSAALIAGADLFFGIDSLPSTMALALGTPALIMFGCIPPNTRLVPGAPAVAVQAMGYECLGCHARLTPPRIHSYCSREPAERFLAPCMRDIEMVDVLRSWDVLERLTGGLP